MMNRCWIAGLLLLLGWSAAGQEDRGVTVRENYFGASLGKVLRDFETKYGMKLQYDSAQVAGYKFDYLFTDTPLETAFEIVFRDHPELSYFRDAAGVYRIVLTRNLPRNRTQMENRRYTRQARRRNITVSGRIKDQTNGEALPFASVWVEGTTLGTGTNTDGYFTLDGVPSDTVALMFKYLGYETQRFYLSPELDLENLLVELLPAVDLLDEVIVLGEREDVLKIPEFSIGVIQTTTAKIADLPALGEKDLFRTFQLMPGISGSNESSAGMYVRGGTPDQNLVLYDGFTIYHQEHLLGVFSAFNTNAVKDVQLHKGGFDAKYGGRLSSVMEIVGKTGNDKELNLGGDIGFLGFNAFVEVPFHEKGSFFLAGRRSFQSFMYDKFTSVYSENGATGGPRGGGGGGRFAMRNQQKPASYFYDLNAKLTWNPTSEDILSLSFFNGEDDLDNSRSSFGSSFTSGSITDQTQWGNLGAGLKWSANRHKRFHTQLSASFSNYYSYRDRQNETTTTARGDGAGLLFDQNTREDNTLWDYSLQVDNELRLGTSHRMEFGSGLSLYRIAYRYATGDTLDLLHMNSRGALLSTWVQDRWQPTARGTFQAGLRLSHYSVTSRLYAEPRLQAFYKPPVDGFTLKASAGIYRQFVNRIVREDISAGSRDLWLLSDREGIPVSRSLHFVAGGSYETKDFLFDVEAYYKKLRDLSEYTLRFAPSLTGEAGYEEFFYTGQGYSRGVDFLIQKKYGKLTGWIGYTLAETRYQFPVYGPGYFAAPQDVTHEFKTVITYKPVRHFTLSLTWIYATGKPFTEPVGAYTLTTPNEGNLNFIVVGEKHNARYPAYHRADLLGKYDLSFIKAVKSSLSLSFFNLYDRANVWYREYAYDTSLGVTETNVNLLGFTPNLTLSIQLK
ncbi:MAG: TonB-dependent receptor [Tannerellaceae bacterium]|jgi:hypothetical protein|nr:TonB-dependent receptor [Tannerellaceae bacterium]